MPQPRTKGGTPKLSDFARHVVVPAGVATTGWPSVRDTCAGFGVTFDPWQDGAGRLILAKRPDGSYAASIGGVVMSIPRQVGKTFLIGAIVFALCLLNPGLTVLWTAHRLRTANETFSKMQSFCRRKKVKPHVAKIVLGSGDEEIVFHNGSRILFGARERGFGRGFDDVDVEVFDEAQILTENAVDDMIPAMNTAANPLPIFIGTPPKPTDPSEVFTSKRAEALEGDDQDTAYVEFSADEDCNPEDRDQWVKANPSYPGRTPDSAMLRMKKNLSTESFVREGLGVWGGAGAESVVDMERWAKLGDLEGTRPSPVTFAIERSLDRKWCSIAVAGMRADGHRHVQIIQSGRGTSWVPARLAELAEQWKPLATVINPSGPAGGLLAEIPEKTRRLAKVAALTVREVNQSAQLFVDGVTEGTIHHDGTGLLTISVEAAVKRRSGEAWVWNEPDGSTDVAPLRAASYALHALAKNYKPKTKRTRRATVLA